MQTLPVSPSPVHDADLDAVQLTPPPYIPLDETGLVVRYADDRGYSPAMRRIDARLAGRRPAALDWPEWTDGDVYQDGPDLDAVNAENSAVASLEMSARHEASAELQARELAEEELDAWLDAIEADRDHQDRYEAACLPL